MLKRVIKFILVSCMVATLALLVLVAFDVLPEFGLLWACLLMLSFILYDET